MWTFLNEISILVSTELVNFHFIYIRTTLGKIIGKITIYAFWYLPTYVTYVKILAHVRCSYSDFIVIFESYHTQCKPIPQFTPPPFIKGGSSTYPKLVEIGDSENFCQKKGELKIKWGGEGGGGGETLSRNGGLPYYIEVVLEIPHDAAQKKS